MANWTGTEKWVQVLNGLRTTWISDYKTPSWSLVSEILQFPNYKWQHIFSLGHHLQKTPESLRSNARIYNNSL